MILDTSLNQVAFIKIPHAEEVVSCVSNGDFDTLL
jgi:hypothetical protein